MERETFRVTVEPRAQMLLRSLAGLSEVVSVEKVEPDEIQHSFEVGDYATDGNEPTPSPEVNTVEIVELIDARADEFEIEETGETVADHNPGYPSDDPVVAGRYPNMGGDQVWHFPESRLYEV